MLQPVSTTHVEAVRQDDARSQIAIGNNILQIGSIHGGIVNISMLGAIAPRPRPTPVYLRPRPFPGLLDRREENVIAAAALRVAQPAEFYGESGLGKTSLFRHLAHRPLDTPYRDGVVYASIRGQTAADVLQFLFEAFYEAGGAVNFKPTEAQIRHGLQDKHALILLDDVDLPRDELQAVIDAAPGCSFLIASTERRLWGDGRAVALTGLPIEDAIRLFERELGRSLDADERRGAETLCVALNGHPLRLLQAAALLRDEKRSLKALLPALQVAAPGEALVGQVKGALSKPESQIVATLASVSGASLGGELIAAATGLADAGSVLERLARRGLVQSTGARHSLLSAGLIAIVSPQALNQATEKALVHVTAWAERNRHQPDHIVQETDAIQRLLKWAVQMQRWKETLRLVVAAEGAFALGRRWGAWQQALQVGLQAARALRSLPAEAWLLHQLGTRALCLGDASIARRDLIRALRLRESLRDTRGATITRHNLNILLGPPPPPDTPARSAPATPASGAPLLSGKLVAAFIAMITLTGLASAIPAQPATNPVTPAVTRAATFTAAPPVETLTPTDQPTSTFTSTPTATSTPIPSDTPTNTPTPTPIPCIPRYGWPIYVVQYGDTLFSIAPRTNSSVYELKLANCLVSDYIYTGQQLLVPRLPQPTATPTPTTIPDISLKPERLNFDNQPVGTDSRPQIIYLASVGSGVLTIDNATLAGIHPDDFVKLADDCTGISLAPGSTCPISVSFAPKAAGERSAVLVINDNAAGSPHGVPLIGIAVGVPLARLDPNSLDFGSRPVYSESAPQYVTLSSVGSADLVVGNVTVDDVVITAKIGSGSTQRAVGTTSDALIKPAFQGYYSDFFKISDGCSNRTLTPGSSCSIGIIFMPRYEGIRSGILTVNDNARNSPHSASLSGIGTVPPSPTPQRSPEPLPITATATPGLN